MFKKVAIVLAAIAISACNEDTSAPTAETAPVAAVETTDVAAIEATPTVETAVIEVAPVAQSADETVAVDTAQDVVAMTSEK